MPGPGSGLVRGPSASNGPNGAGLSMPLSSPANAAFWRSYLVSLPAGHSHRHASPDAFAFGDYAQLADELAQLVVSGRKRATASLAVEFTSLAQPLPKAGDLSIVLRADTTPVAIIELILVQHLAFDAVDAAFAAREGEGDGSLAYWRAAHRDYFGRVCARLGGQFNDQTVVICQSFDVLWTNKGLA